MKPKRNTQPMRVRRESAKKRLEAQLLSGKKPEKINGKTTSKLVALNESDRKRINEQIEKIK